VTEFDGNRTEFDSNKTLAGPAMTNSDFIVFTETHLSPPSCFAFLHSHARFVFLFSWVVWVITSERCEWKRRRGTWRILASQQPSNKLYTSKSYYAAI